ncbi:hypothetical protein EDM80_03000 [bacterium]|nr:MAG: hypothetical protein EDM80_03000 [bacterium]RIK65035.1 MAG: hypothetical protein DCC64_02910 [Planctomycetota bacterium]
MKALSLATSLLAFSLVAVCPPGRVYAGETDAPSTQPRDDASRVAELEKEVAALKKKLAELEARLAKLEKGASPAEVTATKNFEEAMVQLDISDAEKSAIRDSILKCKKAMVETLEVPTAGGRIPAEEVIDCLVKMQDQEEGAAEEFQKLILFLSTEKVPGDEKKRSYLQALEESKKVNRETIAKILSPADRKRLDACHADWSEFELGEDDPFTQLYLARVNKTARKKDGK